MFKLKYLNVLFLFVFVVDGIQSLNLEKRDSGSDTASEYLSPVRALFYPSYKRTTVEEKTEPILQYLMRTPPMEKPETRRKGNQFLDRNQRKKRSIGYGFGLSNPISVLTSGAYGSGYGTGYGTYGSGYPAYGTALGYGYNNPYGYDSSYGQYYGYGYGSQTGYGNYGYGYGNNYFDPNCDLF